MYIHVLTIIFFPLDILQNGKLDELSVDCGNELFLKLILTLIAPYTSYTTYFKVNKYYQILTLTTMLVSIGDRKKKFDKVP